MDLFHIIIDILLVFLTQMTLERADALKPRSRRQGTFLRHAMTRTNLQRFLVIRLWAISPLPRVIKCFMSKEIVDWNRARNFHFLSTTFFCTTCQS